MPLPVLELALVPEADYVIMHVEIERYMYRGRNRKRKRELA
jgi:hypothetical protein